MRVTVFNNASRYQTSDALLALFGESDWLRYKPSEAEIVTVWTGGYKVRKPLTKDYSACEPADVGAFANDLNDIIAEILILRG